MDVKKKLVELCEDLETLPFLRNARRVERDGSSSQQRRLTIRLSENERTVMTDGYQNRRLS